MGFWIFMLITDLLIPFAMIGFGRYFIKNGGPKKINAAFGYRTPMSMKNADTWRFAHTHIGKSWRLIGWILLPVSAGAMLLVSGKDMDTVGTFGAALGLLQIVPLAGSVIPTEIALRKHFDENGIRKI